MINKQIENSIITFLIASTLLFPLLAIIGYFLNDTVLLEKSLFSSLLYCSISIIPFIFTGQKTTIKQDYKK
jgi:hypothetical protein